MYILVLPFSFRDFLQLHILSFVMKTAILGHQEISLEDHQPMHLGNKLSIYKLFLSPLTLISGPLCSKFIMPSKIIITWSYSRNNCTCIYNDLVIIDICLALVACRNFIVSNTTIRTTTYPDWQTRNGPINHEVLQFVTPNVVVWETYILGH